VGDVHPVLQPVKRRVPDLVEGHDLPVQDHVPAAQQLGQFGELR